MPVLRRSSVSASTNGSNRRLNAFSAGIAVAFFCVSSFASIPAYAAQSEQAQADIQSGLVWKYCEEYYIAVEDHRKRNEHYEIRDISDEFLRRASTLKPRNEQEAVLFGECINLANGNAFRAFELIQREEKEDDSFFSAALTKAQNDSAASEFRYMKDIDGKYNFKLELEGAKEEYNSQLQQARHKALRYVIQTFQIAQAAFQGRVPGYSDSFGYNSFGYTNVGVANPIGSFAGLMNAATQLYALGTGSSGALQPSRSGFGGGSNSTPPAAASNFTPAPSGSAPPAAAQSFTPAPPTANTNPTGGGTGNKVHNVTPPPQNTLVAANTPPATQEPVIDLRAKHADAACADYRIEGFDGVLARVENKCDHPVQWHWCWVPKGQNSCEPNSLSGIIMPGESELVEGPSKREQRTASYVVCDMTDTAKICTY